MWCNLDQPIILDNCQVSHVRFSSVKYLAKNDPVINHLQYEYICTECFNIIPLWLFQSVQ